jgi:hypothetical protein
MLVTQQHPPIPALFQVSVTNTAITKERETCIEDSTEGRGGRDCGRINMLTVGASSHNTTIRMEVEDSRTFEEDRVLDTRSVKIYSPGAIVAGGRVTKEVIKSGCAK